MNAGAFQLRRNAKDGKDDLGKVGRGVEVRLGQRTDTGSGALHLTRDHQRVGRVAREPVNRQSDHHVAGGKPFRQLGKPRRVVPGNFLS